MSRGARWSLVGLCIVLALLGLLQPDRHAEVSPTTYGSTPVGYGALYELLVRLDVPVSRSFAAPEALPADAAVWWLDATGLCQPVDAPTETPAPPWSGETWLASGGTAVVFLGGQPADECARIAGLAVPARRMPPGDASTGDPLDQRLAGPLVAVPRLLPLPPLATFEDAGGAEVLARLDERPFVVARPLGSGRLVLVADDRPLRNRFLADGDAAVFAVDLVRAFGAPRIDERASGLHRERDALRYLARSPAVPALAGIALLGVLTIWHGNLWPPRRGADPTTPAPTLGAFVDSIAHLYARTGDYGSVGERYRQLTAARLRRHFGLPAETPLPALLDRLRASRRAGAALAPLERPVAVASPQQLAALVQALDRLVAEAIR